MAPVTSVSEVAPVMPGPGVPARRGEAGFVVGAGPDRAAGPPATRPAAPLDAMLALQEAQEADADAARDRNARRHGKALLEALAALQQALLAGGDEGAALERLAALATAGPDAANPALVGVMRALSLRGAGGAGPPRAMTGRPRAM
ncbi:MAG: flagellar assembly protein FliX [Acetobacteraceae bacterium]